MGFKLGPVASAAGYRLAAFDQIGSTNAEALARARAGDPGRLWVVAREQTAGRGRRGRVWETPQDNLAATLLIRLPARAHNAPTLGFVAGLALESAIGACAPAIALGCRLSLKWPNDVLLDGAKVAGILLEAVSDEAGQAVAVGIGVNTRHAPAGLPYPVASLAGAGAPVDGETLFQALAEAWVEQERIWDEARGFASTRRLWLDRAAGLGKPMAVRHGETVVSGTFETVDEDGRLVLRAEDGSPYLITAGDVHFGAAATMGSSE